MEIGIFNLYEGSKDETLEPCKKRIKKLISNLR
jgi:hypothetical protein